jgi:hypothetical protein
MFITIHWSTTVFIVALVICTVLVSIAREAKKKANTDESSPGSGFLDNFSLVGSIFVGAICAAVVTLIIGLLI